MTDELISKKSLLKEIDELIAQYNWEEYGIIMDTLVCVRDMVFDHPIAYDVGKVTDELMERYYSCDLTKTDGSEYEDGRFDAYNDAIEIVKRGGAE